MGKNNGGIEDILINSSNKKKKKESGGAFSFIFTLIIIATFAVLGYLYYTRIYVNKNISKNMFVEKIYKNNFYSTFNFADYRSIINKLLQNDSEVDTNVIIDTKRKYNDIELSKISFNIKNKNTPSSFNHSLNFTINYAINPIFNASFIANKSEIYAYSPDVVTSYIGTNYDSFKKYTKIDADIVRLDNLKKVEDVEKTYEEIFEDYFKYALDKIPNENFSTQNNIVVQKSTGEVDATGYTLKLSNEEFKSLATDVLTRLKNDDKTLTAIISEENLASRKQSTRIVPEEEIPEENVGEEPVEDINQPEIMVETVESEPDNQSETDGQETDVVENESNHFEMSVEISPIENTSIKPVVVPREEDTDSYALNDGQIELLKAFLGKKVYADLDDVKTYIDELIEKINSSEGDFILSVYVGGENVEKIKLTLPDNNTIEIEFSYLSNQENKVKIVYLYSGENNLYNFFTRREIEEYSADNDIAENSENTQDAMNKGFELILNKKRTEAVIDVSATLNIVENEEIVKKVICTINTEGNSNSKNISNNILVKYSTKKKDDITLQINNKIQFGDVTIDSLGDNALLIDSLAEQDAETTINAIKNRINEVYKEKMDNLVLIDTNTNTTVIEDVSQTVNRSNARNALYNRVSIMMGEAQNEGREFTLEDLRDLTIDGHVVGTVVTENEAIIVVDSFKFKIDTNFALTDME